MGGVQLDSGKTCFMAEAGRFRKSFYNSLNAGFG